MRKRERAAIAKRFLRKAKKLQETGTGAEGFDCLREGLKLVPDDPDLQYAVGHALYWSQRAEDLPEAARLLRGAAERGHVEGMKVLGMAYQLGAGVPVDPGMAGNLFRQAAEHGDTWAMCKLAMMYFDAQGVKRDYAEACFWYAIAAECESNPHDAFEAARWRNRMAEHLTDDECVAVRGRAIRWLDIHPFRAILL